MGRELVLVTGKGGTGKTTVAAGLALAAVGAGRAVVVCELAGQAALPALLGSAPPGRGERSVVGEGLSWAAISPERALGEWVARNAGRPAAALLTRSSVFSYFVAAAPGARELLTVGKAWDLATARRDGRPPPLVVVDGPSTGHALALLQAPRTYGSVGAAGRIGAQAAEVAAFLGDPARTGLVVVARPEDTVVAETLELLGAIAGVTDRPADVVVANAVLPDRFAQGEPERVAAAAAASGDVRLLAVAEQTRLAWLRAREQERQLARLDAGAGRPAVRLPFVFAAALGPDDVRSVATTLALGLA